MSVQGEYPVLPDLHTCQDALGFYGNCRAASTTIIPSDHYFNHAPNHCRTEQDCTRSVFSGSPPNEYFTDSRSMSSQFVTENFRHHHQYRDHLSSRTSPGESKPFDGQQPMYDSEPSSSPASAVSPGGGSVGQDLLDLAPEPIPVLNFMSHPRHQRRHLEHSSSLSSPAVGGPNEEMQLSQMCGMHTHQKSHNLQQQQHRGSKRRALDASDLPVTGTRKERRRTQSINTAFAELRDCIPNVPADTKLSKIKTLRLATSYIAYLTEMVSRDSNINVDMDAMNGLVDSIGSGVAVPMIPADFTVASRSIKDAIKHENVRNECDLGGMKRKRNRTGWPEHVWALELHH